MTLSYALLESAGTPCNGGGFALNSYQFKLLGIGWPPAKGWIRKLEGKEIADKDWELVMELKGIRKKLARKGLLEAYGTSPQRLFNH